MNTERLDYLLAYFDRLNALKENLYLANANVIEEVINEIKKELGMNNK